ncbi:MAG: hypothetical protein R2874_15480 [Desulfobacterales bacterium]
MPCYQSELDRQKEEKNEGKNKLFWLVALFLGAYFILGRSRSPPGRI